MFHPAAAAAAVADNGNSSVVAPQAAVSTARTAEEAADAEIEDVDAEEAGSVNNPREKVKARPVCNNCGKDFAANNTLRRHTSNGACQGAKAPMFPIASVEWRDRVEEEKTAFFQLAAAAADNEDGEEVKKPPSLLTSTVKDQVTRDSVTTMLSDVLLFHQHPLGSQPPIAGMPAVNPEATLSASGGDALISDMLFMIRHAVQAGTVVLYPLDVMYFSSLANVQAVLRSAFRNSQAGVSGRYKYVAAMMKVVEFLQAQRHSLRQAPPESLGLLQRLRSELSKKRKREAREKALIPATDRAGYLSLDEFRTLANNTNIEIRNRARLAQTTSVGLKMARAAQHIAITACFTLNPPMRSQIWRVITLGRVKNLSDSSLPVQLDLKKLPIHLKTPTGPVATLTPELSACIRIYCAFFRPVLGYTMQAGNVDDLLFVGLKHRPLDTFRRATHFACRLFGVPLCSPHQLRAAYCTHAAELQITGDQRSALSRAMHHSVHTQRFVSVYLLSVWSCVWRDGAVNAAVGLCVAVTVLLCVAARLPGVHPRTHSCTGRAPS
jgi:hypothetical protein